MEDHHDNRRFASRHRRNPGTNARRTWWWLAPLCVGILLQSARPATAQDIVMPSDGMIEGGLDSGAPPMSYSSEGSYFSQDLGTTLRARYNTRSYGQQTGNLDIGTMQVVTFEDSMAFFDGQVTLSDEQGVGFNLGLGYRWMHYTPYSMEGARIAGVSLWGDGTSTEADNFFPQIGVSLESLGETWDLRANGYIPVGQDEQVGDFVPTGIIGFQDHFISELATAIVDSSFYVGELEFARRLGAERDAWAFAGPYFLANEDDDTAGYRVGLRGYAYPDLLLQLAVSNDDIFNTNTTFSLTWFIGRTRTNFQPACGLPDRFREPVMRNDYVALAQSTTTGGTPLTDQNGNPFRVTHVDSDAGPGGDGSFERPLNNLNDIFGNSQNGDIVLVHALSEFSNESAVLRARQRLLGEGNGIEHRIDTQEEGIIVIPETFAGARNAARPMILDALGDAVTITDLNEVSNFTIDGGTRAIVSGPSGTGNPIIRDLTIRNTTSDAIVLTPFVRTDTNDDDNDGNVTEQFVAFNVLIEDITFEDIGGDDINLDAFTTVDVTSPNVTLQEAIVIRDISSTNGGGRGIEIRRTHAAGTFTLTNYTNTGATATDGRIRFDDIAGDVTITNADITGGTGFALDFFNVDSTTAVVVNQLDYDGQSGAAGGIRMDTFDGTFVARNSELTGGTLDGVAILNDSDGTFTFEATNTMTNLGNALASAAFRVDGGVLNEFTGIVSVANAISNTTSVGRSAVVENINEATTSVTFNGNITDAGQGILVNSNAGGTILFSGNLDLDTTTNTALTVTNNSGADISFGGQIDIDTTTGNGFVATGGGNVTASNTGNSISTDTGRIVQMTGMSVSNAGVNFGEVNRTGSAGTEAILLTGNTGGPITIGTVGDNAGDSGVIQGGTVDAIVITNSQNVTISGLEINNTNAVSGVRIEKNNAVASTININDLEINNGDMGIEVIGNGAGAGNLTMTLNDTDILGAADTGLRINDVDNGTMQVNNLTVDGNGAMATAGVSLTNSNATFNFDSATVIQEVNGTDFNVNGGTGTVNFAGDITNTAGLSVSVQNVTGGSVNFSSQSSITDSGGGLRVLSNTGGTFSFLGTNDFDTGINDAVVLSNNTGATMTFAGLNINTTNGTNTGAGRGFVAENGGTLSVTGLTNIIETDNGRGLVLDDITIGSVDFQRVTVDGTTGPDTAIFLRDLTGGQVAIGPNTNVQNAGGVLRTTGDAIVIEDVQNVDLRQLQIVASGGNGVNLDHTAGSTNSMDVTIHGLNLDSTNGTGISVTGANNNNSFNLRLTDGDYENNVDIDITGSSAFGLLVDNVDIDVTASGDIAFSVDFSGSAQNGDLTFRNSNGSNTNDFLAAGGSALAITTSGPSAKTIDLLVEEGNFSNSSAANPAALFTSTGNTLMNATIRQNTFDNGNVAGSDFTMTADGVQARMRLNLGDDDPALFNSAVGNMEFNLIEQNGADFDVFELTDTFANSRNNGTVVPQSPAGVLNPGAFQDLPVAPPLPVVP